MKICELLLKNFGKFTNKRISFAEGIHILYGENESGKSTVHTFIRGMLFGIERGRGRAAAGDTFSQYEPWENPNYYSGTMQLESGGKHFIIDRNFDKYSKSVSVVCQEDGEELSVKDGDLDMLLDGLMPSSYDNTISIAQLKERPGVSLAVELKNYAANYYVAGDSDLDLERAFAKLEERKKEADRESREALRKKQEERERLEQEISYVWRDIHRLSQEQERLGEEIACRKERREPEDLEVRRVIDEIRPPKWRIHPVEILVFAAALVISFILIPKPFSYFVTIVLFLCCLIYVWNRMKVGKQEEKTEPEKILEEITPEEEKIPLMRLIWEQERGAEELREKQVRYSNLQEQLEELDEVTEEQKKCDRQKMAAQFAVQRLKELSDELGKKLRKELNTRASEIISAVTGGKYTRLIIDEGLEMSLLCGGKRISAGQVSRGTIHQVYFALRMAAGDILHREEYPVILDDTFVCYDDMRLERTLQWLYENKKQVLIFTCQKREEEALERLGIPYMKHELGTG